MYTLHYHQCSVIFFLIVLLLLFLFTDFTLTLSLSLCMSTSHTYIDSCNSVYTLYIVKITHDDNDNDDDGSKAGSKRGRKTRRPINTITIIASSLAIMFLDTLYGFVYFQYIYKSPWWWWQCESVMWCDVLLNILILLCCHGNNNGKKINKLPSTYLLLLLLLPLTNFTKLNRRLFVVLVVTSFVFFYCPRPPHTLAIMQCSAKKKHDSWIVAEVARREMEIVKFLRGSFIFLLHRSDWRQECIFLDNFSKEKWNRYIKCITKV